MNVNLYSIQITIFKCNYISELIIRNLCITYVIYVYSLDGNIQIKEKINKIDEGTRVVSFYLHRNLAEWIAVSIRLIVRCGEA